jgi:hypothetical protein
MNCLLPLWQLQHFHQWCTVVYPLVIYVACGMVSAPCLSNVNSAAYRTSGIPHRRRVDPCDSFFLACMIQSQSLQSCCSGNLLHRCSNFTLHSIMISVRQSCTERCIFNCRKLEVNDRNDMPNTRDNDLQVSQSTKCSKERTSCLSAAVSV